MLNHLRNINYTCYCWWLKAWLRGESLCKSVCGITTSPHPHPTSQDWNKSFLAAGSSKLAPLRCSSELSGHQPCVFFFFPSLCTGIFLTHFEIDNQSVTHAGVILYGSSLLLTALMLQSRFRREAVTAYQVLCGSLLRLLHMCKHLHIIAVAPFILATLNPFTSRTPRV